MSFCIFICNTPQSKKKERHIVKRIIAVILAALFITGLTMACASLTGRFFGPRATADSKRFKEEYEALNSELKDDGTNAYTTVSIDEVNKIEYLTYDELLDFIGNKTGLLYFGRPGCPWCRLLVPSMLDYAIEDNVTIYYYDIEKDRTENNAEYKNILSVLGEYLPTDTVTQSEDDPDFDPDLKRVVLPQLFFIKDGEVRSGLMLYQHVYLRDGQTENVKQILRFSYNSLLFNYGANADDEGCEC